MSSPASQSAFPTPQAELFLRLLRVSDQLDRAFQLRLRPFHLTHPQYNVLRILRAAPPQGLTCSAIGHSMITAVPDITRLLARLQARKLVAQRRDSADRRVVWTRITARGLALLDTLDPIIEQAPLELLRALSADQVSHLNVLLQALGSGSQPDQPPLCPSSRNSPCASSALSTSCPASSAADPGSGVDPHTRRGVKGSIARSPLPRE